MLAFLRRYQRYFLWVITIMVMISFSFFGTYGVMDQRLPSDPVAFYTVGGEEVRQSQLRAMTEFLSSDVTDAFVFGRGNIFNDGVIAQDFLNAPLSTQLVQAFAADLKPELNTRLTREKRAKFYQHPQAPFLSAEMVWGYFIPETTKALSVLRQADNPTSPEAFAARMQLYTDQRRFSSQDLRRVLLHQERQYEWLEHDNALTQADLSMFGYHTLEDWFGPHFIRVMSEFVLNTAAIAQQRGYQVTSEEAMADLMQQVEKSYKQIPIAQRTAASWQIYFEQQLGKLGMSAPQLVDVWRQILLFRRLFEGVGHALFLNPLSFEDFSRYALTRIEGSQYELPSEVWIPSESVLQKFQTYLDLVAQGKSDDLLAVPTRFKDPQAIAKQYPELVFKRYHVAVSDVNSRKLQAQIGLQEMWDHQTDPANWSKLVQEFPELSASPARTQEERLSSLEKLPRATRTRIDAMTRTLLVAQHPEWLEEALNQAPVRKEVWTIPLAGKSGSLPDFAHPEELMALLDHAPVGEETLLPDLARYSTNGENFYRIRLLKAPSDMQVASFGMVKDSEILTKALEQNLKSYWMKVRDQHPKLFKQDGGAWREFGEVQGAVADLYFKPLFDALQKIKVEAFAGQPTEESLTHNRLASLRLYPYVQSIAQQLDKLTTQENLWVRPVEEDAKDTAAASSAQDQFLLTKQPMRLVRKDRYGKLPEEVLFTLEPGTLSPVFDTPEGQISFYRVTETGALDPTAITLQQMQQVRGHLQQEAQGLLMKNLVQDMLLKEAHSKSASEQG